MRGYMPDIEAHGENEPVGRISVLEDSDGDGRMDKSTVFLDKLVMPRAIGVARDGVLVGVPPKLLFCRDTNGDTVADDISVVSTDYGDGYNPENQACGLLYGLDNWIYNAAHNKRYRTDFPGQWSAEYLRVTGQWGITQDDDGRLYFNSNSDHLRGNVVPPVYGTRNPHHTMLGINVQVATNQECWPGHQTAENRGYRQNFLRDGRLREFTAACSPWIYRGDLFPKEFYGNAFACEASANLVRRAILTETDAVVHAENAYDRKEFIASTYERFRPVDLKTGPDGALYVVDMHHGMIQHRLSVTPYVRAQYFARELDKHKLTGRIFRIVPDGATVRRESPKLSTAMTPQLIELLAHPNSWHRETARRLLVEKNIASSAGPLKKFAMTATDPQARIGALWTLEGMRRLDVIRVRAALKDADPRVRAQAIRLAEPWLGSSERDELLADVLALADDANPKVRLQFALSVSAVGIPKTDAVVASMLTGDAHDRFVRDAVLSGLRARELEFAASLLNDPAWASEAAGRGEMLVGLAKCVANEGKPARIAQLLDLVAQPSRTPWQRAAVLGGLNDVATLKFARRPLMLPAEPSTVLALAPAPKELASLMKKFAWPGKPGYVAPPPPKPLTPVQQARFELGRDVYAKTCQQCHKPDGLGQEGLAPPLANSDWVLGSEQRIARIVLHGLRGPITVGGKTYNLDMPSWQTLSDDQLAGVLTFVRRSWDHDADPVEPAMIAALRKEFAGRLEAWTERELLRVQ
jgi:mono/diheme cytochrome c family protein